MEVVSPRHHLCIVIIPIVSGLEQCNFVDVGFIMMIIIIYPYQSPYCLRAMNKTCQFYKMMKNDHTFENYLISLPKYYYSFILKLRSGNPKCVDLLK